MTLILIGYISNAVAENTASLKKKAHEEFCHQLGGVDVTKQSHVILGANTVDGVICKMPLGTKVSSGIIPIPSNKHLKYIRPLSKKQLSIFNKQTDVKKEGS